MNLGKAACLFALALPAFCAACGPKYACAGLEGGGCTTVAETYLATSDPGWADTRSTQRADTASAAQGSVERAQGGSVASGLKPLAPGQPILSQPRVLRLWVRHWEDLDQDLHAGGYIFIRITDAEWMVR